MRWRGASDARVVSARCRSDPDTRTARISRDRCLPLARKLLHAPDDGLPCGPVQRRLRRSSHHETIPVGRHELSSCMRIHRRADGNAVVVAQGTASTRQRRVSAHARKARNLERLVRQMAVRRPAAPARAVSGTTAPCGFIDRPGVITGISIQAGLCTDARRAAWKRSVGIALVRVVSASHRNTDRRNSICAQTHDTRTAKGFAA